MNWQAVAFLVLVGNQGIAGIAFLVLYARSDWRRSPVGRHLMYWVGATVAVDLSWLLLLVAQAAWLVYVLLAAQACVGVLGWRRVLLVWRAQRVVGAG